MRALGALRSIVAALCLALASADRGILPEYSGFIRVQGGKFVDAACNLFPVTGLNACVPLSLSLDVSRTVGPISRDRRASRSVEVVSEPAVMGA